MEILIKSDIDVDDDDDDDDGFGLDTRLAGDFETEESTDWKYCLEDVVCDIERGEIDEGNDDDCGLISINTGAGCC